MSKQITINSKEYNVYATVSEADEYFAAKFGSEWANVGENQKPQLLVTATRFIDTKDYAGKKVDDLQPLKFPRLLNSVESNDELLTLACCEIAESIYKNNGIDNNVANIKSVSMGDSSISFKGNDKNESEPDQLVSNLLSDYALGGIRTIL